MVRTELIFGRKRSAREQACRGARALAPSVLFYVEHWVSAVLALRAERWHPWLLFYVEHWGIGEHLKQGGRSRLTKPWNV